MDESINIVFYESCYGSIKIEFKKMHIIYMKKDDEFDPNRTITPIYSELKIQTFHQLDEYFAGKRKSFDLPFALKGTVFQKKVWNALCDIPYGETRSYKDIAIAIGNPKACRAVGMANNKNPITIAFPCHRVIGSTGKLVGYAGGLEMKEGLLAMERESCIE